MNVHVAMAVVCLYQSLCLTGKPIHIILLSTTYSNTVLHFLTVPIMEDPPTHHTTNVLV